MLTTLDCSVFSLACLPAALSIVTRSSIVATVVAVVTGRYLAASAVLAHQIPLICLKGCLLLLLLALIVVTKHRKRHARAREQQVCSTSSLPAAMTWSCFACLQELEPDYLLADPFASDRFGYTHLHYAIIQRDATQFQIVRGCGHG
jgi:hypothetical protein